MRGGCWWGLAHTAAMTSSSSTTNSPSSSPPSSSSCSVRHHSRRTQGSPPSPSFLQLRLLPLHLLLLLLLYTGESLWSRSPLAARGRGRGVFDLNFDGGWKMIGGGAVGVAVLFPAGT